MTPRLKMLLSLVTIIWLASFSAPAQPGGQRPEAYLPGLFVSNTSWREKDGRILITGTVNNSSELVWRDVVVSFRGFDQRGNPMLSGEHSVNVVGNGTRQEFSFYLDGTGLPSRYEIVPVAGTSVRKLDPTSLPQSDVRDLPGLTVTTTSWQRLDNRIIVQGKVTNDSNFDWSDVTVNFRGFDKRGFPVVTGDYKLHRLPANGLRDIIFAVPSTVIPSRGEIGLVDGTLDPASVAIAPLSIPAELSTPEVKPPLAVTNEKPPPAEQPRPIAPTKPPAPAIQPVPVVKVPAPVRQPVAPTTPSASVTQPAPVAKAPAPVSQPIAPTKPPTAALQPAPVVKAPAPVSQPIAPNKPPATVVQPAPVAKAPAPVAQPTAGVVGAPALPPPVPTEVAMVSSVSDPLIVPAAKLSGLSLLDATWREQDGRVLVRGTILNVSEFGWADVIVNIRGVDRQGSLVVDGQYKISVVSGRSAYDFSFLTTSSATPTRCEIALVKGKR